MPAPDVAARVAVLPERYQPIFGHPEMDAGASRACVDRLAEVERVVDALRQALGRPVRVLDLGCAQGFFAFSLASRGVEVTGVDRLGANIELCRALAVEHADLPVRFMEGDAAAVLGQLQPGSYDIVLTLSVLHHMCHEQGVEPIARLLADAAPRIEVLLAEVALREEPLYWAAAQPSEPRDLFASYPFVHAVTWHATHLSTVERPLFFASARWCWLAGTLTGFDGWSTLSRRGAEDVHGGTRRYYFSRDHLIKYFHFTGESTERNREELGREAAFLSDPPAGLRVPAIVSAGMDDDHGWLVRELIAGQLLSEAIAEGRPFDRVGVVTDVLDQLCALEAAGLYHGDVRTWNVLLGADGHGILIDYGDITAVAQDCAWPWNLFLSFLVFVREVESSEVLRALPLRTIAFSPEHFTPAYRPWVASLWATPIDQWTFAYLREALRRAGGPSGDHVTHPGAQWQLAIEQSLEVVVAHQKRVADMLEQALDGSFHGDHLPARVELPSTDERAADRSLAAPFRTPGDRAHQLHTERGPAVRTPGPIASRVTLLEGQIAAVRAELREVAANAGAMQARIEARLDAVLGRLESIGVVGQASTNPSHQLEQNKAEIERIRSDAAHWWRATAELQHELEVVYSTLSWRVTAPLRALKRLLSGQRAGRTPAGVATMPVGLRSAAVRFVTERPRLKRWIVGPLDRFPRAREHLKRYFVTGPRPVVDAGSPAAALEAQTMGRTATEVYTELKQAIERRDEDPLQAA